MKNGILNTIVQFREGSCTLGSFAGYRGPWQDIRNHIHSVEGTATVSIHHRTPWVSVCWRLLKEYPFLSLASPAVRTGSPSHLLQEIHIHEKVPSGGGMAGQQDGGWKVILLSDSSTWLLARQYVRKLVF